MAVEPLTLDGLTLPRYLEFRELTDPNVTKNVTLEGNLYVDYNSYRRAWEITFKHLTAAEYTSIREKFEKQFTDETFLNFTVASESIDTDVYMEVSDRNPRWNGVLVVGFKITLYEQGSIS